MKFSENWLRERVEIPASRDALAQRLTLSGLEVSGIETIGGALDGVIVARILACDPHPDADRLRVCRVDTGAGEAQVVCGAPNARAGLVAPLATVGATLPDGITITAARLRGVESAGMLCSARELGIDADASGLMELPADAPVGKALSAYLGLPDAAIEVELTPNRGDCLGMLGLADEVAAQFGTRARPFVAEPVVASIAAPRGIRLEAGADCPRYVGRAVRGIDMGARTPVWMVQRLRAGGVNPVNAVVDVTNYVMLETGQPMHAFDEARVAGDIVVRRARAGETLQLLAGSEAALDPSFLVVADEKHALAVAGIMGGSDSRVTAATRDIFLEAAHFSAPAVLGRARKLGLSTDAGYRFERSVDPELPRVAMERATALLLEIAGGSAAEVIEAWLPQWIPAPAPILLRRERIARVLGAGIADASVARILVALGMQVEAQASGWRVTPPSRRFDLGREEDLIEELARIEGYDALPVRLPGGAPPPPGNDESLVPVAALGNCLATRDYHEAVCYAFVDAGLLQAWRLDAGSIALANPLSADLAVMRTSLLPGLVDALKRNRNRQQERVRLFETGVVFRRAASGPGGSDGTGDAPVETSMLAAVACGGARREQWGEDRRLVDFFDVKGDLEALAAMSGTAGAWSFDRHEVPAWLHPGRGTRILRDGIPVGAVGTLHPALQQALDLPEIQLFEVALAALQRRSTTSVRSLPRFPSLRRDIAVEVAEDMAWATIAAAVRSGAPAILENLVLFDCFRGPGLSKDRKSLAIGLILQGSSRTLTDEDADRTVADVVSLLERDFGARLRK